MAAVARRRHRLGNEALFRDHLTSRSGGSCPPTPPRYRALRLRGLREHPDAFTSSHEEESERPLRRDRARASRRTARTAVFGAFVDGELAGVVGLAREPRAKNRHKATRVRHVRRARVTRGAASGAALLAHVIDEARAQSGLEQLVLTVTDTNVAARTLYEQCRLSLVRHRAARDPRRRHATTTRTT